MFSPFSIFWWFPDLEQNGYLNKVTNILNNLLSLGYRLHSEGFFYSKFSLSTIGRRVCLVLSHAYHGMGADATGDFCLQEMNK